MHTHLNDALSQTREQLKAGISALATIVEGLTDEGKKKGKGRQIPADAEANADEEEEVMDMDMEQLTQKVKELSLFMEVRLSSVILSPYTRFLFG